MANEVDSEITLFEEASSNINLFTLILSNLDNNDYILALKALSEVSPHFTNDVQVTRRGSKKTTSLQSAYREACVMSFISQEKLTSMTEKEIEYHYNRTNLTRQITKIANRFNNLSKVTPGQPYIEARGAIIEKFKEFLDSHAKNLVNEFLEPVEPGTSSLIFWITEQLTVRDRNSGSSHHSNFFCNLLLEKERAMFSETILQALSEIAPDLEDEDFSDAYYRLREAVYLIDLLLNRAQHSLNPGKHEVAQKIHKTLTILIDKQTEILDHIRAKIESENTVTDLAMVTHHCQMFLDQAISLRSITMKTISSDQSHIHHPKSSTVIDGIISYAPLASRVQTTYPALVRLVLHRQIQADTVADDRYKAAVITELNCANTHLQLMQVIWKYINIMENLTSNKKILPASDAFYQQLKHLKAELLRAEKSNLLTIDQQKLQSLQVDLYPDSILTVNEKDTPLQNRQIESGNEPTDTRNVDLHLGRILKTNRPDDKPEADIPITRSETKFFIESNPFEKFIERRASESKTLG